ncbi:putative Acid phosphatase [Helianthus annuus]|nr:putative Acid phosphatase [Helianthus annuus]
MFSAHIINSTATRGFPTSQHLNYTSGQIHDVTIGPLEPNTEYYYRFAPGSTVYSFKTPPVKFPIKFAISGYNLQDFIINLITSSYCLVSLLFVTVLGTIQALGLAINKCFTLIRSYKTEYQWSRCCSDGDLGQTGWTQSTLEHVSKSNYDVFLLPGDLSYADTVQPLWDSFGRLVEPQTSRRPWMVTQGNHDSENITANPVTFIAYNARWRMPFEESGSGSNLYYSFEVAGYRWLVSDLKKVDRNKTPWLVVLIHAPWYNSNYAHQGEIQSVGMMDAMEGLLYKARVDVVLAGHVHAYERFNRVYNHVANNCGPVHITIGDGGNLHGLASNYTEPQPTISAFREASFGHGQFEVVNASYAKWSWHRNQDDESVQADSVSIINLASNPACNKLEI